MAPRLQSVAQSGSGTGRVRSTAGRRLDPTGSRPARPRPGAASPSLHDLGLAAAAHRSSRARSPAPGPNRCLAKRQARRARQARGNAGKCVGQARCFHPSRFTVTVGVSASRSASGDSSSISPITSPGSPSATRNDESVQPARYAAGGGGPDADRGRHPATEATERVPVLLANCERVAVVDRHVNSSTRRG